MGEDVPDAETATEIAREYADTECVGQLGEIVDAEDHDRDWIVEFRTHTFSDAYVHRVRISKSVGNVISHDRSAGSE